MDVKQSKITAFFIDNLNEAQTLSYIDKNAPLLKAYMLLFTYPMSDTVREKCNHWNLTASFNSSGIKNKAQKVLASDPIKDATPPSKEILRTIRSGESISVKGDLLIGGNVNDGASLSSGGNMSIFGIIKGDIHCNGSYLILTSCHSGRVMFQGELINEYIKDEALKIFYKEDDILKVKELH